MTKIFRLKSIAILFALILFQSMDAEAKCKFISDWLKK